MQCAKHFVTLPDGTALARLLDLAGVAAVDRLDRRRAHRVALEEAVFADAALNAAVLPYFAVLVHFPVMDARQRTWTTVVIAVSVTVVVAAVVVAAWVVYGLGVEVKLPVEEG